MAHFKKSEAKNESIFSKLPPTTDRDYWGDAEISQIDTEKDVEAYIPKEGHEWRQQGPYLICNSCPLQHATYIGMKKQLIGFENSKPIFKHLMFDKR